jgi:Mitochondrial carrier protein
MPSVGLYFGVYSYCKRILVPYLDTHFGPESKHKLPSRLLFSVSVTTSAAVGNTVASFSRVPYEVVKQNLQTGMYTSTWQALTHMAKEGGVRAFFPLGGVSIQMLRDIPYAMVTLLSYEILKEALRPLKTKQHYPEGLIDALTGALAGGLGSYVTNPLDVIKTRLQTNPELYAGSIRTCARDIWLEGGSMAFLRGSVPRLLHKVPANGCFFLFYEFFRAALHVGS